MIELRTLGALELATADGAPLGSVLTQPRRVALLCYLALASPRGFHRRDSLYTLFWPEHRAEQARHALRQSLYFLRRALGPDAIVSRGADELALAPERVRCDAVELERLADEGRLEEALALYRGDLLVGFHIDDAPEFERWLDDERARLRRRAAEAAWALAERRERDGDATGAAEWGRRAAASSPADETALRRLLLLLDRLGDRAAAVRAYEAFVRDLEREYELEPSAETRDLVTRLRAGRERSEEDAPDARRERAYAARASRAGGAVAEAPPDEQPLHQLAEREARPAPAATAPPRPHAVAARSGWNRPGAWLGLGMLLALLGAGTWRLMAGARPEPTPSARERVVVADFTNLTSDSTFGDLVAHVLSNELARSPALSVVGRETIADALSRMQRQPGTRLTSEVAREVAAREAIKLVVEGDIRAAGTGLVISAAVIETATGDEIHGASETARDSTQVLAAIERLSNGIRHGIGESLASIRATDSLWSFTTSSLAALRKHVASIQARARGDFPRSIELLEEAIALDSNFAHAYVSLAGQAPFMGLPRARFVPGLVRAYALRGRLTERERYAVEGHYYLNVTGDLPRAIAAFQKHVEALRQFPSGEAGWYGSLAAALELAGDLPAAGAVLQEARQRFATPLNQSALIGVLYALGEDAELHQVLEEASRRFPENPALLHARARLLANAGRYDDAHALAARIRRESGLRNDLRAQADLDAVRGRFAEAVGHLRQLRDQALTHGELAPALEIAAAAGRLRLLAGEPAGVREVDDLLARHPIGSLDVLSRPYLPLALFYAEAGQPRRARAWLDAYEREFPSRFRGPDASMLHRARAATYRAEGNLPQALEELQNAARTPALRVGLFDEPSVRTGDHPELARVYDALGSRDSAISVYERYLAVRSLSRTSADAFALGPALERLGALYEARGDRARAATYYRRLADLWRGADAALRPRAEAARRRAMALAGDVPLR